MNIEYFLDGWSPLFFKERQCNKHKCLIWASENPYAYLQIPLQSLRLRYSSVWLLYSFGTTFFLRTQFRRSCNRSVTLRIFIGESHHSDFTGTLVCYSKSVYVRWFYSTPSRLCEASKCSGSTFMITESSPVVLQRLGLYDSQIWDFAIFYSETSEIYDIPW